MKKHMTKKRLNILRIFILSFDISIPTYGTRALTCYFFLLFIYFKSFTLEEISINIDEFHNISV